MQDTEPAPGLEEFDLGYYGWRVVLAACLGVMAGFGSLFVCTFAGPSTNVRAIRCGEIDWPAIVTFSNGLHASRPAMVTGTW